MIGAALLLGVLLAFIVATRPSKKLLFSPTLKVVIAFLCSIFAAYVFFIALHLPDVGLNVIGQALACVMIIAVCVAIGNAIRKRKSKK